MRQNCLVSQTEYSSLTQLLVAGNRLTTPHPRVPARTAGYPPAACGCASSRKPPCKHSPACERRPPQRRWGSPPRSKRSGLGAPLRARPPAAVHTWQHPRPVHGCRTHHQGSVGGSGRAGKARAPCPEPTSNHTGQGALGSPGAVRAWQQPRRTAVFATKQRKHMAARTLPPQQASHYETASPCRVADMSVPQVAGGAKGAAALALKRLAAAVSLLFKCSASSDALRALLICHLLALPAGRCLRVRYPARPAVHACGGGGRCGVPAAARLPRGPPLPRLHQSCTSRRALRLRQQ